MSSELRMEVLSVKEQEAPSGQAMCLFQSYEGVETSMTMKEAIPEVESCATTKNLVLEIMSAVAKFLVL